MKRSPRRSAEYWAGVVAQWQSSGQSESEFCAQQGLVLSTFQKWRRHPQGASAALRRQPRSSSAFVEVRPRPASVGLGESIVLRVGEDVRLECPLSMGVEALARLTRALCHGR